MARLRLRHRHRRGDLAAGDRGRLGVRPSHQRARRRGGRRGSRRTAPGHPLRWRPPYTSADRLPKLGGSAWHSGAWAAGNNDHGDIVGSTLRGRLTPDKRDYGGVDARFHLPVTHVVAWTPQPRATRRGRPDVARLRRQQRRSCGRVRRRRRAPAHHGGLLVAGRRTGARHGVSRAGNRPRHRLRRLGGRLGRRCHRDVHLRRGAALPRVRLDRFRRAADAAGRRERLGRDRLDRPRRQRRARRGHGALVQPDGVDRPTVWRCASLIGTVAEEDES